MTNAMSTGMQIQEIEALLGERRKYEQWLAQLEAHKDRTPEHVYSKVRGDYTVRLNEAQSRLAAESNVVQKLVTDLEKTVASQARQIGEKRDERSEAELRASVGEHSEKEWDKLRGKLDASIADLTGKRDSVQRELDALRALLGEATATAAATRTPLQPQPSVAPAPPRGPTPRVSSAVRQPEPTPALPQHEAPAAATAAAAAPAPNAAETPAADGTDELAFLRSVLGRTTPATAPGGQQHVEVAAAAAATGPGPLRSDVMARMSTLEPFATPQRSQPAPPAPSENEARALRPSGAIGAPTPRTSQAVKSLKCQECGTLNYPTEWYCERCGGEMAAF